MAEYGGTIGAEAVVRASPDGYTLLLATTVDAINVTLYEKVNFILDVTPVASIARTPNVMVVHPSFQPETIPELIAYAKANPGKINISGGPAAGTGLIAAELFKLMAGVNMVYVSYRGMASALNDLLGGHLQLVVSTLPAAIGYIRADRLRALAVTSAARSQVLREIPTVADFLPGYEFEPMVRRRSTQKYAPGNSRKAQQGNQCGHNRFQVGGTAGGPRKRSVYGVTRRLRQAHRRRDGEMGQSDQGCQHQSRISSPPFSPPDVRGRPVPPRS